MRFLILSTVYPRALGDMYDARPELRWANLEEQYRATCDLGFGLIGFQRDDLDKLGHVAVELITNCGEQQLAWMRERASWRGRLAALGPVAGTLVRRALGKRTPTVAARLAEALPLRILEEQVRLARPDVLVVANITAYPGPFLRALRRHCGMILGQCAYPIPWDTIDLSPYDLMVSASPEHVERFRAKGLPSEYLPHAFPTAVLTRLGPELGERPYDVTFTGGLTRDHARRIAALEAIARRVRLSCFADAGHLSADSPLRDGLRAPVWGYDMYRVLGRSKIVVDPHIDVAGQIVGNMRMYEATGMGALLMTEHASNLAELFEPGRECVAYHSAEECAELAAYYLQHEEERAAIAARGQARTLRNYSLQHRMQRLASLCEQRLAGLDRR